MTALGAAGVFFFKTVNKRVLNAMLGFAAGVMIAASYWSLLAPAIEMTEGGGVPGWIPAASGFYGGPLFLPLVDNILPHLHPERRRAAAEGIKTDWQSSVLLILAITLENCPKALPSAWPLAQWPVDCPPRAGGRDRAGDRHRPPELPGGRPSRSPCAARVSRAGRAFWYGQLSGVVEPVAGVLGAAAVMLVQPILPYALTFAAGAMIYVVVEELIPESQQGQETHLSTMGAMLGFAVMMILDVALG